MNTDISNNEIDKLEKVLNDFECEWEDIQRSRASKWRITFFVSFIITLAVSIYEPSLWWSGIIVIGYFAGSLYSMLRQRAKTTHQIIEHQKQLKLVRLLRKFHTSPYSEE